MKCIGGPMDDEWFTPPSYYRLHDRVNIPEKQSTVLFNPMDEPGPISIEYYIYVIDCFNFSKNDIYYFLRHENLTNKQAMLHQFSKKCLRNYR